MADTHSKKGKVVLLINPKDSYILGSPPLGVGYLMSYSKKVGKNEVFFHDENYIDPSQLNIELEAAITEYAPTFVGISFPSSTAKRVAGMVKHIKEKYSGITVFAGGYHPTSEPEATLRLIPDLDFIILGQAEHTFANVGEDWKALNSVAYLTSSGKYVQNEITNPIGSLDDIPYVDRLIYDKRYFDQNYVIAGIYGKTGTIMSSRGCPYRCFFCSNELLQKKVNFHSVDYVAGEIEWMLTQIGRIDYLSFLDVMFLTKWSRTQELCEVMIRSKMFKKFRWAATVSANVITYEKAKLMKAAGCFYLSFGFESNSPNSLRLMNKIATPEHNEQAIDVCKKVGLLYNSAFLFGIPGESEEDLRDTLDLARKYNIFSPGVNIMKPLPGSPYYYEFIRRGIIKRTIEDWHDISSIHHYSGYFNENLSPELYEQYVEEFKRIVRFKSKINHYRANLGKLIKYKIIGLM